MKGCLLVNHWKQSVYYLTEYDPERGAKGYEFNQFKIHNTDNIINWPPFTLEAEFTENKWQVRMLVLLLD